MHEMSLIKEVLKLVLSECEGVPVKSVDTISLTVGEQRDVVEKYMENYFHFLARGTMAESATFKVERVPFMVRCTDCLNIFKIDTHDPETWSCPRCGAYQKYRVFSGHEFQVTSIEVTLEGEEAKSA